MVGCAAMKHTHDFFINGVWVRAAGGASITVVNPADEMPITTVALATPEEVAAAVQAAANAFPEFARTSVPDRMAMLESLLTAYRARADDIASTLVMELGTPTLLAAGQVKVGEAHLTTMLELLPRFSFVEPHGSHDIVREPIGVCAAITPWNAPVGQVLSKLVPAIAAGCTSVIKPSEVTPLGTLLLGEIIEASGLPPGVANLVNGDGKTAGTTLAAHPLVDMVSFTGSMRSGVAVAQAAAPTIKRVVQELGGKSANIILRDANLDESVSRGVTVCCFHSGQACAAPTRMLVPREQLQRAAAVAAAAAQSLKVGLPMASDTQLGPLVNRAQYERVIGYIRRGDAEGAKRVAGSDARPAGLTRGYFVLPTVFTDVDPAMSIAQEEIFGPVLCLIGYDTEADAIRIANGTDYGLAAYVSSGSLAHAREVALQLRAGYVCINYPPWNPIAPFGGYKRSGNGRQYAEHGLLECLETKSLVAPS
jgi:aldehyde dehydrogenase (NAD+)